MESLKCNATLEDLILYPHLSIKGFCTCGTAISFHPRSSPYRNIQTCQILAPDTTFFVSPNNNIGNNISSLNQTGSILDSINFMENSNCSILPSSAAVGNNYLDGRLKEVCEEYGLYPSAIFQCRKSKYANKKLRKDGNEMENPFQPFDYFLKAVTAVEHKLYPNVVKGSQYVVKRRNQTHAEIHCRSNKKGSTALLCRFAAKASKCSDDDVPFDMEACSIQHCFLYHDCQTAQFLENCAASGKTIEVRKRKVPIKVTASSYTFLKNLENCGKGFMTGKTAFTNKVISESLANEDSTVHPSVRQVGTYMKHLQKDGYHKHVEQFCELPSFLAACKKADPNGFYYMNLVKCSYEVKDITDRESLMFDSLIFIPSAGKQFFNNSNKVLVIDGTHMHSKWDGIMLCIVGVDAEGGNLTLGIALVPQENMVYWQLFF